MATDTKSHAREILLILFQSVLAIAFGIMGFKVRDVSVAVYVAAAVVAISAAFATLSLVVLNRLERMENGLHAHLDLRNLDTRTGKISEFRRLRSSADRVVLFCDHGLRKKLSEYGLYENDRFETIGTLEDHRSSERNWDFLLPYEPQMAAVFFFRRDSPDTPSALILVPWGGSADDSPWSVTSHPAWCEMSYHSYDTLKNRLAISDDQAVDFNWLIGKATETLSAFHGRWSEHRKHRIVTNTPEWIYREQNALSERARWIHAFDMTEISEWGDADFLGGCLLKNIQSAKAVGNDGEKQIRRIIFAPSRQYLDEHPEYKRQLVAVIRRHFEGKIGCGLAFEEDVQRRNPEYIRDCVVYDRRVVWVETIPTTKFRGEGYFSTDPADVNRFMSMFDDIWQWQFSGKFPSDLAHDLVASSAEKPA